MMLKKNTSRETLFLATIEKKKKSRSLPIWPAPLRASLPGSLKPPLPASAASTVVWHLCWQLFRDLRHHLYWRL